MNRNLGDIYESFLSRCVRGVRKEQEAFQELAKARQSSASLEQRRKAVGLQEWGREELTESYLTGKEAFEKEGDVYSLLSLLKNLARCRKELLEKVEAEREAKHRKREQEAEEEREREEKARRAKIKANGKKVVFVALALFAVLSWIGYMADKREQENIAKATAELVDGQPGKTSDETKTIRLPGGATMEMATTEIIAGQPEKTPGETKVIQLPDGVTMEMVWCPAGSFTMGSPMEELGRDEMETQHQVTLTKGFWMAKTEVTQTQWKSVMGNNPSYHEGDNLPVEQVSWEDCQEFCQKADLALPTEAEWEYACRAGTTGPYAGPGNLDRVGWYQGNSGNKTHPVGQKQPNAWGLYDMHGNVTEWCEDWYGFYPYDAVTNPVGLHGWAGVGKSFRVSRGGDYSGEWSCRSANRGGFRPDVRNTALGFRPVSRQE